MSSTLLTSTNLVGSMSVWLERRKTIEQMLIKQNPHLSAGDVSAIVQGCWLYATCDVEQFAEWSAK